MCKLNDGETFFSYGVTLPKIKDVAKLYYPNHELAMALFATKIRELKLVAIYIDNPLEITYEQMELWQKSFISLEIAEHCASMLFSKSNLSLEMALKWALSDDSNTMKSAYLIGTRRARFYYDETEQETYQQLFDMATRHLKSQKSNALTPTIENFIAAIVNRQESIKKKLLNMLDQGELAANKSEIEWQFM